MTTASRIAWDDVVLPFQLDRSDIRGRVARLDRTIDQIITQHNYPPAVQGLVAEAAMLTALVGQTIKLRWKLSFQVRGDGPIRLIATDYYAPTAEGAPAQVRAYASFADHVPPAERAFDLLGEGLFSVTIDQGPDMKPYQGITPLAGGSLAACASSYFAQSEQLPTRFVIGAALSEAPGEEPTWRAGGVMIQALAKPGEAVAGKGDASPDGLLTDTQVLSGDDAENWNRATILLETAELTELIGPHVGSDDLLRRLFHEEAPRVFDPQPIDFGCTCSKERLEAAISTYGADELADMTLDDGSIAAECQFCGAAYEFTPNI